MENIASITATEDLFKENNEEELDNNENSIN